MITITQDKSFIMEWLCWHLYLHAILLVLWRLKSAKVTATHYLDTNIKLYWHNARVKGIFGHTEAGWEEEEQC